MEVVFEVILPIFGFVLAIVGAWDKLRIGIKYVSHRRTIVKLKLAEYELEKIDKYNNSVVYFVAYELKQLFSIVIVLLAIMLVNSFPNITGFESPKFLFNAQLVLVWLAGYFSGQAMQAINYVLKKDKLKSKYEIVVKNLAAQTEQRT
ncbi:hypothetical protein QX220_21330 [Vibrio vulnificus]|uniref:hypothetical protein n=1 Tax=Vibrio TaxID=662 RepID=UPI00128F884E|nr:MULTISPECIES: hypothetical protein [Vibrio]MDS1864173.1 hypothetical protein [Vibrio vulnificus]MQC31102.1 hypothetical protein [Vibrio parahaemolyticus]HAS6387133.1 hypothetical protein [Vibrio vulnificus]HDY7626655.1 hypothetical protein [Vibrio vulnificus]HEB2784048.1 hypothetical protein [Vibrio vulnificus]